ncbi:MAG TPA: hypothetical protein VHC22_01335 [Pirellulales bacterium]|nr:hypothetical protein [Pirellulales bacterium]
MNFDWQNLAALTVVVAAAAYVVGRAWRLLSVGRSVTGCGQCASCPGHRVAGRQLVSLSPHRK